MIIWPAKEPAAAENFAFNFADALGSETITTQVVVGDGVTVSGATIDGTSVTFKLSAGTAGTVAKVTCTVVLSDGQTLVETGVLPIGGEAVSLATAKAAQRIDQNSEDALLAGYLGAAIGHVERITGRNLTAKVETLDARRFPEIHMGRALTAFDWQERPIRLQKAPVSEILTIDTTTPTGWNRASCPSAWSTARRRASCPPTASAGRSPLAPQGPYASLTSRATTRRRCRRTWSTRQSSCSATSTATAKP
jgi:hypothetical protein